MARPNDGFDDDGFDDDDEVLIADDGTITPLGLAGLLTGGLDPNVQGELVESIQANEGNREKMIKLIQERSKGRRADLLQKIGAAIDTLRREDTIENVTALIREVINTLHENDQTHQDDLDDGSVN